MKKESEASIIHQLIFLGDSLVGKTCTLLRYIDQEYNNDSLTTIGVDSKKKNIIIVDNGEEKEIEVLLIDTAGQERFRTITSNFYKNADGIILMFDVTNQRSFKNIQNWINEIQQKCKSNIPIFIVGNKIDLNNRIKSKEEFEKEIKQYNYDYYEVSARNNIGIKETIDKMCLMMYKYKLSEIQKNKSQSSKLLSDKTKLKRNCC